MKMHTLGGVCICPSVLFSRVDAGVDVFEDIDRIFSCNKEIGRLGTEQGLLGIKSCIETDSITWYVWVRKLATFYKKPWWKFVQ